MTKKKPAASRSHKQSSRKDSSPACRSVASAQTLPADEHASRFLLQELRGCGGVCEVHAALDLRRAAWSDADPRVAVKRLLPCHADNYQAQLFLAQEFSILRHLTHPGVVRVFDLHQEPFGLCYSMELLEGSGMPLTPSGMGEAGFSAVAALFDTLAFLHRSGVAHGDIKPSNIVMERGGRLVLIDFNTAALTGKSAKHHMQAKGLRQSLHIPAFSALYSSPEHREGLPPTPAADVFSACCTAYEFLCGRHPLGGRPPQEALREGVTIPPPDGVPQSYWHALRKGLSPDPMHRPDAHGLHRLFAVPGGGLRELFRRCLSR